jgi:hypothetical protein
MSQGVASSMDIWYTMGVAALLVIAIVMVYMLYTVDQQS